MVSCLSITYCTLYIFGVCMWHVVHCLVSATIVCMYAAKQYVCVMYVYQFENYEGLGLCVFISDANILKLVYFYFVTFCQAFLLNSAKQSSTLFPAVQR